MNPFLIDIRSLPVEGRHIEGTMPPSFFALAEGDAVQAVSPVGYSLEVRRDGKDLTVTGELSATFSLQCGRCTERFEHRLHLQAYALDVPIENETTIDLTAPIREDILLALPSYPRCEDGNVNPHPCPAEGRFDHHDEPQPGDKGVWDALDNLNR